MDTKHVSNELKNAFSPKEAAVYLGLAHVTLAQYRQRGGGPAYAKLGKAVRYYRTDLDSWIAARRIAR